MRNGKETAIDRTRRLFYVCCTRALKDLAVVLFTQQENLELAKQQILSLGLFPEECIHFQSV
jgi:DNA helicase-2/ATP-dependent DNA helicase PcrA